MEKMTMNDIRKVGIEALTKTLGPVGATKFLQQFDTGQGNYSKERDALLQDMSVKDIVKEIENNRKK